MQNLDTDVAKALKECLNGDDATRRACVYRVFTKDAVFHHASSLSVGVDNIFGTYQLWRRNNITLDVNTKKIIANADTLELMVDSHEYCWIWWLPTVLFGAGPTVYLHTLFKLRHTPEGYKFYYQSDHSMFVESILHLQLPPFVDEFFKDVYSPICGKVLSFLGGIIYDILVRINHPGKEMTSCPPCGKHSMHPESYKQDLARALKTGFEGNYRERRQMVASMYSDDAVFWHPFFVLKGPLAIANYFQWWLTVNRSIDLKISGFIVSKDGREVMVDVDQHVRPWWWPEVFPPFVLFIHMILYFKDAPGGGKVIYRQEDHTLWVESVIFGNPVGRWWKHKGRLVTGRLFGAAGHALWELSNWWQSGKPEADCQALLHKATSTFKVNGKAS